MYDIGYTAGVYDLFHVGHLRLLKRARALCDRLIIAVSSDELVEEIKGHPPKISLAQRLEIIEGLGIADDVIVQESYDKVKAAQWNDVDVMFIGRDHFGEKVWKNIEKGLDKIGVDLIYLPHTNEVSTTKIREKICK